MSSHPVVTIVGRPNVGKSTFFNRIIGRRKALVKDEPGITRDRQYTDTEWDGVPFTMMDTGGLELNPQTPLQTKMAEQAWKGVAEADLILFVVDGRAGLTPLDKEWIAAIRKIQKPKFFVVNKIDSASEEIYLGDFYALGFDDLFPVSSETGRGVADLLDRVVSSFKISHPTKKTEKKSDEESNVTKISIIGKPNAGKSTLLNHLLNDERAIVDPTPGTTRDPINTYITHNKHEYCFIDTAGLRKRSQTPDGIDKIATVKTLQMIDQSQIVIMMIDAVTGLSEQDAHVAGLAFEKQKAILVLVNKWDEAKKTVTQEEFQNGIDRMMQFLHRVPVMFVSAKTGLGLNKFYSMIEKISEEYSRQFESAALNELFHQIVQAHPTPVFRGHNIVLSSIRQMSTQPPTFMIKTSEPEHVHFSYQRYLTNALMDALKLKHVPIRLLFRKKGKT